MLVALGFLTASLLALMIAPLFWARAVRLTSRRIKESMPVSEIEIRADKDRIRAEYAIKVHKMESEIEQVRHSTARQQIEINRRDASVNELEAELESLRAKHEESLNARRVLEQTVADRLPRVEQGLNDAKKLLFARDREISELTRTGDVRSRALDETKTIAMQQQAEIERLKAAVAARAPGGPEDVARSHGELALRSEIEALRAKTREQAQLLARLQSLSGRTPAAASYSGNGTSGYGAASNGASANGAADGPMPYLANEDADKQVRLLKARNDDQAGEIAKLKAALSVFENGIDADGSTPLRDSRIGVKARMQSLEAQTVQQGDAILRLRNELAAANERLARQASHFTNELKRLGSGANGASSHTARRNAEAGQRLSLTERVQQSRVVPEAIVAHAEPVVVLPGAADEAAMPGAERAATPADASVDPALLQRDVALDTDSDARPRLLDRIASIGRT